MVLERPRVVMQHNPSFGGKFNQRGGEAPELVKLFQNLNNVTQPLEGVSKPFVNNIVTRT